MLFKPIPCSSTVWFFVQPPSYCSCYKVGEGTIPATKQIEGFNLQREGDNCYCSKIKSFSLQRKERGILTAADQGVQSAEGERDRYSCRSIPKGSICIVRETIVAAAKSNGSICRGRQTDILPEANPKGSICRGRKTHTPTFLLQQSKAFNLQREREILACCCSRSKLQSAGTIAMKRERSSLPFGDWMKSCGATHLPSCRLQQQSDKICGLSPLPTSPSLLLPCSLSYFYSWKI